MFKPLDDLKHWAGDGVIARIESEEEANRLKYLQQPVVDVAGAYKDTGFYQVNNDDVRTGEQAAEYLLGRGFSRFAYCGVTEESGFSTLQRFYSIFKRFTERTPGEFRRSIDDR